MKIQDRLKMLCYEEFHASASNIISIKFAAQAVGGREGKAKLIT